jgi:small-conductance mechanosensitive channel
MHDFFLDLKTKGEWLYDFSVLGNRGDDIFLALGGFFLLLILLKIFRQIILVKISHWCARTRSHWDDRISVSFQHISPWAWYFLAFYASLYFLVIPDWFLMGANLILIAFLALEGTRFLQNILTISLLDSENDGNRTAIQGVLLFGKMVLWSTVLLLFLANLGVNVTTLVASLGIGGVAVALASQNILEDLFASFSIYIDRPFQIGDFIEMGDESGTVQKIGLKTTRIKTKHGEELVYANKDLTKAQIHNYKRMNRRRVDMVFHFDPSNASEKLDQIAGIARSIVEKFEGTAFNYAGVLDVTAWSYEFKLSYYMESPDWDEHVEKKEQILLDFKKQLEKEKIQMIFSKTPALVLKE